MKLVQKFGTAICATETTKASKSSEGTWKYIYKCSTNALIVRSKCRPERL
jgi:hypothetical protein